MLVKEALDTQGLIVKCLLWLQSIEPTETTIPPDVSEINHTGGTSGHISGESKSKQEKVKCKIFLVCLKFDFVILY